MDIDSSNWLYDYGFDISVAGAEFPATASGGFNWMPQTLKGSPDMSLDVEYSLENSTVLENGPSKRLKSESCASGTKACREKLRRDKLNERFLELSSILEPGKLPKTDKAAILSDAARMVTELRSEAQKLKETNDELLVRIKELKGYVKVKRTTKCKINAMKTDILPLGLFYLKNLNIHYCIHSIRENLNARITAAEKNELRDEKNRLKMDKEKLEKQVKAMNAQPTYLPHPSAAFTAQGQTPNHKLIPFVGYPGIAMWQFLPPSAVDTSQDHLLRPPVA